MHFSKQNILKTIIIMLIVNGGFVYISFLTYHQFRLSLFHIFFGLLPLGSFLRTARAEKVE